MKRYLLCIGFLLSVMLLKAQEDFKNKEIIILPESELIIVGSTNVNKFDCRFNIDLISKPITLRFAQREECFIFNNLRLQLLTDGYDCGNKRMNSDFQDLLLSEQYPEIVMEVDKAEFISAEYLKVFITVQIAGQKKSYDLPVQTGNNRFKGKFKMNIRDFGLEPPTKALGLIEVDEEIEVQFDLKVLR